MNRLISLSAVIFLAVYVTSPSRILLTLPSLMDYLGNYQSEVSTDVVACGDCEPNTRSIIFTGDLMLARHVERLALKNGDHYSFQGMTEILSESDIVIANFEATIRTPHIPTPDFAMRFSVPYRLAALLTEYKIDYVSLANNHADDYGDDTYRSTKELLAQAGVTAFGHPVSLDNDSITYIELDGITVAIIAIHNLYRQPKPSELTSVFSEAADNSDWQIAYVHWGDEYDMVHNQIQEKFAKSLIAAGADAIIGHHPHVVQDISVVDGVPVFYSLGNFIFDQYFSNAVQEGLLVRLQFLPEQITYELLPITMQSSLAQPRLMGDSQAERFLSDLRQRSNLSDSEQILVGLPSVSKLATSTQISIMTE